MNKGNSESSTLLPNSKVSTQELSPGCIIEYISGKEVKATPEEVEVVQVFARRLAPMRLAYRQYRQESL